MIDWSIRFGDILVIVSILGTIGVFAFRSGGFTQSIESMKEDLVELKLSQRAQTEVLAKLAVYQTRIDSLEKRIDWIQDQIEDMRHGRGFILEHQDKRPLHRE